MTDPLVRPATPDDAHEIGALLVLSSGGLVEYVTRRTAPDVDPVDLIGSAVAEELSPYSYRNCLVTTDGATITAAVNAYPAEALRLDPTVEERLSPDDLARLKPLYESRVDGSLYLSGMGVAEGHRGEGLGRELMKGVVAMALRLGRKEISLMVWADNVNAVRFYAQSGFTRRAIIPINLSPELPHKGGMYLMVAPTPEAEPHAEPEGIYA